MKTLKERIDEASMDGAPPNAIVPCTKDELDQYLAETSCEPINYRELLHEQSKAYEARIAVYLDTIKLLNLSLGNLLREVDKWKKDIS